MPFAVAAEMLHNASIMADDLPVMDNMDIRRGKPTPHVLYGAGRTLLGSYDLLVCAFQVIDDACTDLGTEGIAIRSSAYELVRKLVRGEEADIMSHAAEACIEDVERAHLLKTGSLFEWTATTAASLARTAKTGPVAEDCLVQFCRNLALAYQITDDLNDVQGTAVGKPQSMDIGKATYVSALGPEEAFRRALAHFDAACEALSTVRGDTGRLEMLARAVCSDLLHWREDGPPWEETRAARLTTQPSGAKCDVLIIGAGPSGTCAACHLAERGYDVLIIDSQEFPRYKPCAGGLLWRAIAHLPVEYKSVTHVPVYRFRLSLQQEDTHIRQYDEPLMILVDRAELDDALLKHAVASGARCLLGDAVGRVEDKDDHVLVTTVAGKSIKCGFVIGAYGSQGDILRNAGLHPGHHWDVAMEAELVSNDPEDWQETAGIDWGTPPGGYAWVMPKNGTISAGVGGPLESGLSLRKYWDRHYAKPPLSGCVVERLSSHPLRMLADAPRFSSGRCMVVGDAAGLIDPLTREGLSGALISAGLAAGAIATYLSGRTSSLAGYDCALDTGIVHHLRGARAARAALERDPKGFHRLIVEQDKAWDLFCQVLRGECTYTKLLQEFPAEFAHLTSGH